MSNIDIEKVRPVRRPLDIDEHVGRRLRQRRVLLGISQEDLAAMVSLTPQQISKQERGVNRVHAGRLFEMAKILGVEPGYFFEGLKAPKEPTLTTQQRVMLELGANFVKIPTRQSKQAVVELARALNPNG